MDQISFSRILLLLHYENPFIIYQLREEINILAGNPFEKQITTRWIRSPFNPTSPKVTKRCPSTVWHEFHLEISKSIPGFLSLLVCPRWKNEIFMRELEFSSCLRQYGGKNAHKWLVEELIDGRRACKSSRKNRIGYFKILAKYRDKKLVIKKTFLKGQDKILLRSIIFKI